LQTLYAHQNNAYQNPFYWAVANFIGIITLTPSVTFCEKILWIDDGTVEVATCAGRAGCPQAGGTGKFLETRGLESLGSKQKTHFRGRGSDRSPSKHKQKHNFFFLSCSYFEKFCLLYIWEKNLVYSTCVTRMLPNTLTCNKRIQI
jgi:hypothetical protein